MLEPGNERLSEETMMFMDQLGARVDTDVLIRARQWLRFYI